MNHFSLQLVVERARASLWLLPGVSSALAVLLAKILPVVETRVPHGDNAWYLFPGQAESARTLLSTIAASMMTFTALVFSITILVLQLASSQFSPRVLRTFLSDRTSRRALASFVGTFVYAMALLPEIRNADSSGNERVPAFSVFCAFIVVLVSVAIFIHFIHGVAQAIQTVHVLRRVADSASESIADLYPEGVANEPDQEVTSPVAPPDQRITNRGRAGVVAAIDEAALLVVAHDADAVIEVLPALGDFVVRGGTLFRVWGGTVDVERIADAVVLDDDRTPRQDPAFAFRQLVDIAERALSPGTNDPTTAVQALDRIHDLLASLVNRRFPDAHRVDDDGRLRLILPRPDWDAIVHLAFDEIRHYGASSIQVVRRMRAALEDLHASSPPCRRPALELQLRELDRAAAKSFEASSDRARSREASLQGQGPVAERRPERT